MKETISKKHSQLLDRSFKTDLKLFLFDYFLRAEIEYCNENNYYSFTADYSLENKYRKIKQLSNESTPIPETNIAVGLFDKALKKWFTENKNKDHSIQEYI